MRAAAAANKGAAPAAGDKAAIIARNKVGNTATVPPLAIPNHGVGLLAVRVTPVTELALGHTSARGCVETLWNSVNGPSVTVCNYGTSPGSAPSATRCRP